MPASKVIHDGRSVVPGSGSNSIRLANTVSTIPTPVHKRGTPTWTSTAKASIAAEDQGDGPAARGQRRQSGAGQHRADRADDAGDADTGGEELEDQQRQADQQQEVRHRRAGHGVEELVDEAELGEADDRRRVARAVPSSVTDSSVVSRTTPFSS